MLWCDDARAPGNFFSTILRDSLFLFETSFFQDLISFSEIVCRLWLDITVSYSCRGRHAYQSISSAKTVELFQTTLIG